MSDTDVDLPLDQIRIDGGTQPRAEINQEVVAEHQAGYELGEERPRLITFFDGVHDWLADGFHRYFGAKAASIEAHPCTRKPGTQRDAILFSVGANTQHGLRRTNEDKRKAVETVLKDEEWSKNSNRWIADACGVSPGFVDQMITERSPEVPTVGTCGGEEKRQGKIGKDGKVQPPKKKAAKKRAPRKKNKPEPVDSTVVPFYSEPEPEEKLTLEDRISAQQKAIESFARGLVKWFDDNLPDDPWLDESRVAIAKDQLKSAAASLRLCKAHDKPCPKCDGRGGDCRFCKGCGYLPKNSYEMAGGT